MGLRKNIIRKYRPRIKRVIEKCPETSEKTKDSRDSEGYVTPDAGQARRDKAYKFLRATAAIVANWIKDDRATWEVQINRSVDIFFADDPTPEHLNIRKLVQKTFAHIADGHRRFVDAAIQKRRTSESFSEHLRRCIRRYIRATDPEKWAANDTDIEGALNAIAEEMSGTLPVTREEYFAWQGGFGSLRETHHDPSPHKEPGDYLSWLAVERLRDLRDRFNTLNCWRDKDSGQSSTGEDVHLVDFDGEDGIAAIEEVLILSGEADTARPFMVLARIYFAYYSKPDEKLLHLPPAALDKERQYSGLRILMPVEAVKDALERIIADMSHTADASARRTGGKRASTEQNLLFLRQALVAHHRFDDHEVEPNWVPATSKELQDVLSWGQSKVSRVMKTLFRENPMARYKRSCQVKKLGGFLKKLDDGSITIEAIAPK